MTMHQGAGSITPKHGYQHLASSWTLRTRLVVALVALLAVTLTAVGALTVVALDRFLVGQLDDQLQSAVSRASVDAARQSPFDPGPAHNRRGPSFLVAPGQAPGTIGAIVSNGEVVDAAVLDSSGSLVSLPIEADSALATIAPTGEPQSVDLGNGLGTYRVVGATGPRGALVVTGLPLTPVSETVQRLGLIISVVAIVGLIAAGTAAAVIISYSLRPLRRVAATATQVAGMPLDSGDVALSVRVPASDTDPHTEVGQVGAAINHMLENVATALTARHVSEQRVRSFVADASHELRTPLASIRGYAELTRRSPAELPDDVANAIGRIESESIRMTSLVEDLLLLARLDAGRPMEVAPVDLTQLVVTCASDAHVAGPDHKWALKLPDHPVIVAGDADRLHQLVANLLTNARVHTPPGTHVAVSLLTHDDPRTPGSQLVQLLVRDTGPGIPAQQLPEVFGRFSRGDTSRSRAAGSTGLGLAIASAVVAAHHGSLSVRSSPGDTLFTVELPGSTTPPV